MTIEYAPGLFRPERSGNPSLKDLEIESITLKVKPWGVIVDPGKIREVLGFAYEYKKSHPPRLITGADIASVEREVEDPNSQLTESDLGWYRKTYAAQEETRETWSYFSVKDYSSRAEAALRSGKRFLESGIGDFFPETYIQKFDGRLVLWLFKGPLGEDPVMKAITQKFSLERGDLRRAVRLTYQTLSQRLPEGNYPSINLFPLLSKLKEPLSDFIQESGSNLPKLIHPKKKMSPEEVVFGLVKGDILNYAEPILLASKERLAINCRLVSGESPQDCRSVRAEGTRVVYHNYGGICPEAEIYVGRVTGKMKGLYTCLPIIDPEDKEKAARLVEMMKSTFETLCTKR